MILLVVVLRHGDTTKISKTVVKDLLDDETEHFVGMSRFDLAIAIVNFPTGELNGNLLLDETYFTVSLSNTRYDRSSNELDITHQPISFGPCGDRFEAIDRKLSERKEMDKYLCPTDDTYSLIGDFNSGIFQNLEIFIFPCVNSTANNNHCQSDADISSMITSGYIDLALVNTYFDFDDYDEPVKSYVTSTNNMFLTPDLTQYYEGFIQQNKVSKSDNIFFTADFEEEYFYTIENRNFKTFNTEVSGGAVAVIQIALDQQNQEYERVVFTFIDMFGFIGGLFDSLFFFGF